MKAVAFIADAFVAGKITGVIVNFHGLGDPGLRTVPNYAESEWASAGGLVVMPYPGPWAWMNRQSRAMVDELIEAIYREYSLQPSTPLILTGGSMGGYCSLLFARYTRHRVAACMAIYPACDLKYHFSERPDLPRTIHHAFAGCTEDMETLFKEHSTIEQAAAMPRVPYLILQSDADKAVNKEAHADRMAAELKKHNHTVEYIVVPGMGHHEISAFPAYRRTIDFVKNALK